MNIVQSQWKSLPVKDSTRLLEIRAEELDNWTDSPCSGQPVIKKKMRLLLERAVAAYRPVYQDADPPHHFETDVKG